VEHTRDAVARGFLTLWQPRRGYRFNLDSVLLGAWAVAHARPGLLLDAGAGCGVVGLYAAKALQRPVLLVERQAVMASLCAQNSTENLPGLANVVRADFGSLPLADRTVGTLMCNPPYLEPGSGRESPNEQRQLSLHAVHGGASHALREAERVLTDGGVFVCVVPVGVGSRLSSSALHLSHVLRLRPEEGAAPTRVLMAWERAGRPVHEEERTLHAAGGKFQPWLEDVLEGRVRALLSA
jgi:tRNA1(Val) A37 N6-methylase TrmN6